MSELATATAVAQAVSLVVDEAQEGMVSLEGGLFLGESDHLRVTEVSAELVNREGDETSLGWPYSQFTVKTSDGQEWTVRITPKA